jgi:hypothetical protein
MQITNGGEDLAHDLPGGGLAVAPPLDDAVEEVAALEQLHHDVNAVLRLERAQHLDDVGLK